MGGVEWVGGWTDLHDFALEVLCEFPLTIASCFESVEESSVVSPHHKN